MSRLPVFLVAMATAASLPTAALDCPDKFRDLGLDNGRCYFLSNETADFRSWMLSFTGCQMIGGNLLSVADPLHFYSFSFFVNEEGADAWIGLLNIAGQHSWVDESTFNTDLDEFFDDANATDLYGYISAADGLIHVADGSEKKAFICYATPPPPTTPPAPTTTPSTPPPPTTTPPPCADPWIENQGWCYYFNSSEKQFWGAAGAACRNLSEGADLLSIHDPQLVTFLLLRAGDDVYWTGLQNEEDLYVWEDGSDATNVADILGTYLDDWEKGKNCVALDKSKFPEALTHQDCFTELPYICQKPAN